MSRFPRLVLLVVVVAAVVAAGATVIFVADQSRRATEQPDPTRELGEMANSLYEPIVPTPVTPNIREAERSRRARRPADPTRKTYGLTYDVVRDGWDSGHPRTATPAEPMPPTSCRSVEPAPRQHATGVSGPYRVHDLAVSLFETASGFGLVRMATPRNDRGVTVASPAIDRVELVSLLTDTEPSVYVLDQMATPPLARQATRRPLDEFERRGLDAVRRGEHLVWTPEAPTRMFGAIRARTQCLECHTNAAKGDLLGAFTYYLTTPVDRLGTTGSPE